MKERLDVLESCWKGKEMIKSLSLSVTKLMYSGDGRDVGRFPDDMVTTVLGEICDFMVCVGLNSLNFGLVYVGYIEGSGRLDID